MAGDELSKPGRARELIASNEATALDIRSDDEWHDKCITGARRRSEDSVDEALDQIADDQLGEGEVPPEADPAYDATI